jgi:hypothetical protein
MFRSNSSTQIVPPRNFLSHHLFHLSHLLSLYTTTNSLQLDYSTDLDCLNPVVLTLHLDTMSTPTLINLPPPPSDPVTPDMGP